MPPPRRRVPATPLRPVPHSHHSHSILTAVSVASRTPAEIHSNGSTHALGCSRAARPGRGGRLSVLHQRSVCRGRRNGGGCAAVAGPDGVAAGVESARSGGGGRLRRVDHLLQAAPRGDLRTPRLPGSAVPEPVRPSATAGGATRCNALSVQPSACRSSRLAGARDTPSRTRRARPRAAWPSDTADGRARSTPGPARPTTTSASPAARPGRPRKRHRCAEAWSTGARWLERHGGRAVRPPRESPVEAAASSEALTRISSAAGRTAE